MIFLRLLCFFGVFRLYCVVICGYLSVRKILLIEEVNIFQFSSVVFNNPFLEICYKYENLFLFEYSKSMRQNEMQV